MATTGGDGGDIGVDSGQLLLIGICLVGLVAAAFLAPVVGANNLVTPGGNGSLGDGPEREPPDPEPAERPRTVVERADEGEPESGDGIVVGEYSGCFVRVEPDPTPGRNTTVLVTVDGETAAGVPVWFNGEFVGRTAADGSVTGTVPFVTELNVTVTSPIDDPCRFSRRDPAAFEEATIGTSSGPSGVAAVSAGRRAASAVAGPGEATPNPLRQQDAGGLNNSTQYAVESNVSIRVTGDPIPGENITLLATVAGAPMADATVAVDGTRVGRTDENGRYELTVPDSDSVEVTVSRGEISGTETVDIVELSVRFEPRLVVPGEGASVAVTRGGKPVENATVTLDGQSLGTTGQNGTVSFALPLSVSGTVTATAGPQSATVPLWLAYWLTAGTALLLAFCTAVTTAIAAGLGGRRAAKRVASLWGGIWTLFVGYVVGERLGLAVAAAAVSLVALYRYRRAVASGGVTTAGVVADFLQWCSRAALWVVGALESLADSARAGALRLGAWLRSLPTSLSGLATRLVAWVGTLPARLAAGVRSLPLRVVAAVVGAGAVVAVATVHYDAVGFLVAVAAVVLAGLARWLRGRDTNPREREGSADQSDESTVSIDSTTAWTLRQLWRRLARWVFPGSWRTRTPAEVSRAAIERGLPRGPVETLTEAFRDVEYGGKPAESHEGRAESAYETLERHRDSEGERE